MLSLRSRGAAAYAKAEVETSVPHADPHQLILMLFDGAMRAVQQGALHMARGDNAAKGAALSKAIRIVDEGLKIALDDRQGGELALQLKDLYDYISRRILMASARNESAGLEEALKLLGELRDAWASISPAQSAQSAAQDARPHGANVIPFPTPASRAQR